MEIDLDRLGQMHPVLDRAEETEVYRRRGACALERSGHGPGVDARVVRDGGATRASLRWSSVGDRDATLRVLDANRLTEDGAEAVALAFVHVAAGWTVRRRVQREGAADWLLVDRSRVKIALEISGTVTDDAEGRLRGKREQVSRCPEPGCRLAAVVIGFQEPCVLAATNIGGLMP
jgi:hypothetical protein